MAWGVRYYGDKRRVLVLPSIQQGVLFSLRGHTLTHSTQALVTTIKVTHYIYNNVVVMVMIGPTLDVPTLPVMSLDALLGGVVELTTSGHTPTSRHTESSLEKLVSETVPHLPNTGTPPHTHQTHTTPHTPYTHVHMYCTPPPTHTHTHTHTGCRL